MLPELRQSLAAYSRHVGCPSAVHGPKFLHGLDYSISLHSPKAPLHCTARLHALQVWTLVNHVLRPVLRISSQEKSPIKSLVVCEQLGLLVAARPGESRCAMSCGHQQEPWQPRREGGLCSSCNSRQGVVACLLCLLGSYRMGFSCAKVTNA